MAEQHSYRGTVPQTTIVLSGSWKDIFENGGLWALEEVLPAFLMSCRWFGGKGRGIERCEIADVILLPANGDSAAVVITRVVYTIGPPETYALTLAFADGAEAESLGRESARSIVVRVIVDGRERLLCEAVRVRGFAPVLLEAVARGRRFGGRVGELWAVPAPAFDKVRGSEAERLAATVLEGEQSNTSILFGGRLILKLIRRVESGPHPDEEIGLFLSEVPGFENSPPLAGVIRYHPPGGQPMSIGLLHGYIPNEGDAWRFTVEAVRLFLERVMDARSSERREPAGVGADLESARILGRRTARLHLALASRPDQPGFAPEPFTIEYQRSLHLSMCALAERVFDALRRNMERIPTEAKGDAERLLARRVEVLDRFAWVRDRPVSALRTRVHGDYHLGQVLWTGGDFVILDFEGEPSQPLVTRRVKQSPLRDVAGMVRSYHYAAFHALSTFLATHAATREEQAAWRSSANDWYAWVSGAFVETYLQAMGDSPVLPRLQRDLQGLLSIHLLEKAVYELGYELDNRPEWVWLPLQGIAQVLAREW